MISSTAPSSPFVAQGRFSLAGHVEYLRRRVRHGDDAVILVDGYEGSGKSQTSLTLGAACDEDFNPEPIDRGGNIIYASNTWADFVCGVRELPQYSALVSDDVQWLALSRDFMKSDQRKMMQLLMTVRQRHLFLIMNLPSRFFLDKYVRDHRAQYWWHMVVSTHIDGDGRVQIHKGIGELHQPSRSKWHAYIFWEEVATVRFPPPGKLYQRYQRFKGARFNSLMARLVREAVEKEG